MNLPFYIAKRYAVSFSKNSAINTITIISSIAIVASAMSLFVFLSIFSGLREFTLSYSNSSDPDFKIEPRIGKSFILSQEEESQLKNNKSIAFFSKIIEDRVLFQYDKKEQIATIKGVDSIFSKVTKTSDYVYIGNWISPNSNQAIIGSEIARKLSLGLFDYQNTLDAYAPKPGKGLIEKSENAFNIIALQPVGMFNINEDIDGKYIYCDIQLARKLFDFKSNQISSIEFKTLPNTSEETIVTELKEIFKDKVTIKTKAQLNDSLYKMLNSENLFIYLFSTLIVILTLFCLAGAIVMIIIDKKENINTLYNIGLTFQEIRNVFFVQGIIITLFGLLFGLVLGTLLIVIQQQFSVLMITSSIAYPVQFKLANILLVIGTIIPLGVISSWIASGRVNKEILK
ncbi:MAG: ABC transporter permease [Flavobacterium sp.]|uniref:ABC transporter permease n=1 Tax=unclassified Flavobacterium TaxID=196869 RepID=UPI000C4703FE|nr:MULTISPECIES: FtsX-like permease family protein [unclassified Flavobacterium]MBF02313.1 ABC transporter permease [Flavobacterium sp.]MCO6161569.1 FtsX-like permease family protein [Flavobacterium sp. NRK F7]